MCCHCKAEKIAPGLGPNNETQEESRVSTLQLSRARLPRQHGIPSPFPPTERTCRARITFLPEPACAQRRQLRPRAHRASSQSISRLRKGSDAHIASTLLKTQRAISTPLDDDGDIGKQCPAKACQQNATDIVKRGTTAESNLTTILTSLEVKVFG